jgi:hypothetical protein
MTARTYSTHDIYSETCLHARILAEEACRKKFPETENTELEDWLENRLFLEFRESESFREKLRPCWNSANVTEEANKVRDWLIDSLLPSWLPKQWSETKAPAIVHAFDNAPKELQEAASKLGDEDWILEMPPTMDKCGLPPWVEALDSIREPTQINHPTKPGWQLIIGHH